MRTALTVLIASAVIALAPAVSNAQQRDGELRSRVRDMVLDRDAGAARSRDRTGSWDWERNRDANRSANRDWERQRDRDRDRYENRAGNRGNGRGYGYGVGRNDERKAYERAQRDFERRTRNWNRYQWDAFRDCERDMWQRSRWDRNDSRSDSPWERQRIRDYCESRVSRLRW